LEQPGHQKASARQMTTIKSQSPNSGMRSETFIAVSLRQIQDIFKAMVCKWQPATETNSKTGLEKARWASEQAEPLVAEVPWLSVNCFSVGPLAQPLASFFQGTLQLIALVQTGFYFGKGYGVDDESGEVHSGVP